MKQVYTTGQRNVTQDTDKRTKLPEGNTDSWSLSQVDREGSLYTPPSPDQTQLFHSGRVNSAIPLTDKAIGYKVYIAARIRNEH